MMVIDWCRLHYGSSFSWQGACILSSRVSGRAATSLEQAVTLKEAVFFSSRRTCYIELSLSNRPNGLFYPQKMTRRAT